MMPGHSADHEPARTMNLPQSHHIYFQPYHGMQDDYPNLTCNPGQLLAALQQYRRKQRFVTSIHHRVDQR
jgi:hypothetical protein